MNATIQRIFEAVAARGWLRKTITWIVLVILGLFIPVFVPAAYQYIASLVVIAAIFAVATAFVVGFAGVTSFGNQVFYGAGGYLTGYLAVNHGLQSVPVLLIASTAIGAATALVMSVLLREQIGLGFGMITLAVGQLVYLFVYQTNYLYGLNGIPGILRGDFFGFSVAQGIPFLQLCVACLLVVVFILWWIRSTMFGRILAGIRNSPERSIALGVPIRRYRVVALTLSGAFSGTAGCLYAMAVGAVDPDMFNWTTGATPVLAGIIGGIRTVIGPVLGGVIYESASDTLSNYFTAYQLITAAIVLVIFVIRPEGIVSHRSRRTRNLDRRLPWTRSGGHSAKPEDRPADVSEATVRHL